MLKTENIITHLKNNTQAKLFVIVQGNFEQHKHYNKHAFKVHWLH